MEQLGHNSNRDGHSLGGGGSYQSAGLPYSLRNASGIVIHATLRILS